MWEVFIGEFSCFIWSLSFSGDLEPVCSPVSCPHRLASAPRATWVWLVAGVGRQPASRNWPCQVVELSRSSGFTRIPCFILEYSRPWENWNKHNRNFFQGIIIFHLALFHPPECLVTLSVFWLSRTLRRAALMVSTKTVTLAHPPTTQCPDSSPFLKADLVWDGDVIGMKTAIANIHHILSVCHTLC